MLPALRLLAKAGRLAARREPALPVGTASRLEIDARWLDGGGGEPAAAGVRLCCDDDRRALVWRRDEHEGRKRAGLSGPGDAHHSRTK